MVAHLLEEITANVCATQPIDEVVERTLEAFTSAFEPKSFGQAMACKDREKWLEAMRKEIASLIEKGTWELCNLPPGRKAISSKWVYKVKYIKNVIDKYKARLVVKGFSQKYGVDYTRTFSPVARMDTIRLILVEAFLRGMHIDHIDIKNAFLNGTLKEEIYMKQPKGFEKEGMEHLVCRLIKSLYGLKQAGREWHKTLIAFLREKGFKQLFKDPCVFKKGSTILVVYVDDIIVISETEELRTMTKKLIMDKFKARDLGPINNFLSIEVKRTSDTLTLSQEHYVEKLLEKFQMSNSRPAKTPMQKYPHPEESGAGEQPAFPYREAVGALMYLAVCTRPDIATAVSNAARNQANPTEADVKAVKFIFRYLNATKGRKLTYHKSMTAPLFGAGDSDWANPTVKYKSRAGHTLIRGGAAVVWKSRVLPRPCLSSAEAEYKAASQAARDIAWARQLYQELGWTQQQPTLLQLDNQQAIRMTEDRGALNRTKHVAVQQQYVTMMHEEKQLLVEYVHTNDNVANLLTKGLQGKAFRRHSSTILGEDPSWRQQDKSRPHKSK